MAQGAEEQTPASTAESELAAGRYTVHGVLGRGGMAVAYDVRDNVGGRRCALKRLVLPERVDRRAAAITLFEREFLTLSQLQHPNVVNVFDYGVDDGVPYYTMELLTGGDLLSRVPLPWRAACAMARDLCSVLALLHSRRLIYRDLNPRNVRSSEGGLTKLIDFGAMSPMGPNRQLVGTLTFCAPEAVQFQPLDARTDLYALGIMLYLMLTGRVPYHARDFAQLQTQWQRSLPPPSKADREIPAALDQLVADLTRLDPALRPPNAAEVIERLCAVAGMAPDERLTLPQAYLSTPNLIGRSAILDAVREKAAHALAGHGSSVVLNGPSGSGRSRLLGACELEAKLLGMTVLRADATDSASGPYGAARALALQLLDVAAEPALALVAPHAPVLVHVVPELRARIPDLVPREAHAQSLDRYVQPALRAWLVEVSRKRPLMIAVDDVDRIDGASAAFIALLAQELPACAMILIASAEPSTDASALLSTPHELLLRSSSVLAVEPLAARATQQLLGSVFGDVPNLQLLAHRLHDITSGNPRDLMQMAQHLVDQGVLRYRNGAWTVPGNLDGVDLPSGMAQALRSRAQMLSADAQLLALTIAQCPDRRFGFEDCLVLVRRGERARVMQCLDELLGAGVLRLEAGLFALAQHGWIAALAHGRPDAEREACNERLAELFALRGDEFRVAQHLLRAGQTERGLDVLIEHAITSRKRTDADLETFLVLMRTLPSDWYATYEYALQLCRERARPRAQNYALRARLCGILSASSVRASSAHFEALIDDLRRSAGLDLYEALDPALPPLERLKTALEGAQRRHDQAAPADRIEDPATAVRDLARVTVQVAGVTATRFDHAFATRLRSLEPLYPLSTTLRVIDGLVRGVAARISGRLEQALAIYTELLERLAQPDRAGLDPSHHSYTVLGVQCGMGMIEATIGREVCLARAAQFEAHPHFQVQAILIRMLYQLWQGDQRTAQRLEREAELARIQNTQPRQFDAVHLLGALAGHAMAGELTGVKQVVEAIAREAQSYAGWVPLLHYARAEHHRLRGDAASALIELETALAMLAPGAHQVWIWVAAAHVRVLVETGQHEPARVFGARYLAQAQEQGLGYTASYVRVPLSLALANEGDHRHAAELAQTSVDELTAAGASGLSLCHAYEALARVAIRAGDVAALQRGLALLDRAAATSHPAPFLASLDRVTHEARRAGLIGGADANDAAADDLDGASISQMVHSSLSTCMTPASRAQAALELLVRSTASHGGLLYTLAAQGPVLQAETGELAPSPEIAQLVREYLTAELSAEHTTTLEDATSLAARAGGFSISQAGLRPLLLSHEEAGQPCPVAVAVLLRSSGRQLAPALVSELSRALRTHEP